MTTEYRFPTINATATQPSELELVLVLASAATQIPVPGTGMASVLPWRRQNPASPFTQAVIEWTATTPATIGSGVLAQAVGLYGRITDTGITYLIGLLGMNLGNAIPQIPISSSAVGYSQIVNFPAAYDFIGIGAVSGSAFAAGTTFTVFGRPILERYYAG